MHQHSRKARLRERMGQGAEVATRPWSYQVRRKSGCGGCDASMNSSHVRTDGPATIPLKRGSFKSFWQVVAGLETRLKATGDGPVIAFAGALTATVLVLAAALTLASPSLPWLTVLGLCALTFV